MKAATMEDPKFDYLKPISWGAALIAAVAVSKKLWKMLCGLWDFLAQPVRVIRQLTNQVEKLATIMGDFKEKTADDMMEVNRKIDRLENMQAVNRSLAMFVYDHAKIAYWECELPSGDCTYVNEALSKLFGLSQYEMLGNGWMKAIHPDDVTDVQEHWQRTIAHWLPYSKRYRIIVDGKTLSVESRGSVVRNARGENLSVFGNVIPVQIMTEP